MKLIFKLHLEGLMIVRRKCILEAEKYPSDREAVSMCEPHQI